MRAPSIREKARLAIGVVSLGLAAAALAAPPLPALNVQAGSVTVSGLSSGGFMANQLGVAHSSLIKGVGVFAAGPYRCGGHNNYTACMYNATISASMLATLQADINNWSGSLIDDKSNLAAQKVFLFVGSSDFTVGPNPMNGLNTQYANNGVGTANRVYVQRSGTAHVFPTDFAASGNNSCGSSASPYIANCSYDGAKAVLQHFYGPLNARNNAPAAANYIEFDQREFTSGNPGMAGNGWLYVPAACAGGATACRLHVALHGCKQDHASIGDKFVKNTGYTRWADTNNIIVLFPQTQADNTARPTPSSGTVANPNACWDWIGWYGNTFAHKGGTQVAAIKAMIDRLSSNTGGGGGSLPAPTGVATSGATGTSMVVSWAGVTGAASYRVFRGGTQVNTSPVTGTSFTDSGLSPATTYSWTVAAVDGANVQGAMSTAASGTTTGTAPSCTTASNYAHVSAGRATQSGGYAYAKGSNQNMGLWNVFVTTTLKNTAPNHYVIGTCP